MSDLHLEFAPMTLPGGDILLLVGDICVAAFLGHRTDSVAMKHREVCKEFFYTECAKYNQVYYIAGNHEHYNGIFDDTIETLREFLENSNVRVLDKELITIDGWNIYAATMWTDYDKNNPLAKQVAQYGLNDHRTIKKVNGTSINNFSTEDALAEHNLSLKNLDEMLYDWEIIDKPTIVMTHHAPSQLSVHERYKGDALNHAFYSDLSETMFVHPNIKYWFHGHTHDSFDYIVGECRVIANPRGYARFGSNESENKMFNINFELEI